MGRCDYDVLITGADATVHLAGPSEADVRKQLTLEEEEEFRRSKVPIPERGTCIKYLHTALDLEEAQ